MRQPGITATVNGKNKTLYMQSVEAIRKRTKDNLPKRLSGESSLSSLPLPSHIDILKI